MLIQEFTPTLQGTTYERPLTKIDGLMDKWVKVEGIDSQGVFKFTEPKWYEHPFTKGAAIGFGVAFVLGGGLGFLFGSRD
jgi:hypothetical protein